AGDDRDEAQFVIQPILAANRRQHRPYGDFAVLYRTNAQSRSFEEELLKYDVPYVVVGGVRFYDRAEVKDVLAYLKLVVNPSDNQSLRRIVNRPARGIGKTTLERADAEAVAGGVPLLEGLARYADSAGGRTSAKVREFLRLHAELSESVAGASVADAVGRVLDRSGYLRVLEQEATPEAEARVDNLKELLSSAEDFDALNAEVTDDERSRLELFLDQVALISDLDGYEQRSERVSLMTAHSAKGLEFSVVFLVGMEEGVFPHAAADRSEDGIEEERRLCYVGMTRAMERLVVTCAAERRRFGTRTFQSPSRFLEEIPDTVLSGERARPAGRPREDRGAELDYSYAQEGPGESGVSVGMRVRHPLFGPGAILAVIGEGLNQKLKIRFERAGVKTVVVRYANLELG
ncbi:MAG: ATP-binding domain-containing protein, partial [Proteobacteria bacterium]|nr:ATP-binding domain-containing protein [Pseudomonadota bacterium]